MTVWFHTTILATSLAATIAIGIASAAKYDGATNVAPKADMLPVTSGAAPARATSRSRNAATASRCSHGFPPRPPTPPSRVAASFNTV